MANRNKTLRTDDIIWDWNGTLLDDRHLCVDIMNRLLRQYHLPGMSLHRYLDIFSFPIRKYYNTLGWHDETVPFETISTEFIRLYEAEKSSCSLRPFARETLDAFHKMGRRQFILSASKQDSLDEILAHYGLTGLFTAVYGLRDHYARGKTEIGHNMVSDFHIVPGRSLFIGDTTHDAEVAGALSIPCILIQDGHNSPDRLRRCACPVFRDLRFIPRFYW